MATMKSQRQLGVFRNMLIYAGIRNTPKPLPFPYLDPVDEFWYRNVVETFGGVEPEVVKERVLIASRKISEETAWEYNPDLAFLTLDVSETTTFEELYGGWFVLMMQPRPLAV